MSDVATLFAEHHASLWRFLSRLTGDADLAADAAQLAFVRYMERGKAPADARAWLFSVGRNAALEAARTRNRRSRLAEDAPARTPVPDAPRDPAQEYDAAETQRQVRAALERLTEKERTILLMREEGFAHREIAEAVGSTTGSIGTMIARALDKLALELDLDGERTA